MSRPLQEDATSKGRDSSARATIKAHSTLLCRPRPYGLCGLLPFGGSLWSSTGSLPHRSFRLFVFLLLSQQRFERVVQDIFAGQQYIFGIAKHMLIIISLPEMVEAGEIGLCM